MHDETPLHVDFQGSLGMALRILNRGSNGERLASRSDSFYPASIG
jgi:hypothetical protein